MSKNIEGLKEIMRSVAPASVWRNARNGRNLDAFYHIICQKTSLTEEAPDVRAAFDQLIEEAKQ